MRGSTEGRLVDATASAGCSLAPVQGPGGPCDPQQRVVVVGFGNALRGDDAVGREVVEALWLQRDRFPLMRGADFLVATQLTPEMAEDIASAGFVLFVDASLDRHPVGSVTVRSLEPAQGTGRGATCYTDLTPQGLLRMSLDLYGRAPTAALVTVSVAACGAGTELSPLVRAAVPIAVASAQMAVSKYAAEHKNA